MAKKKTDYDESWLSMTIEYLQELHNDLECIDDHERADELQELINYLQETN